MKRLFLNLALMLLLVACGSASTNDAPADMATGAGGSATQATGGGTALSSPATGGDASTGGARATGGSAGATGGNASTGGARTTGGAGATSGGASGPGEVYIDQQPTDSTYTTAQPITGGNWMSLCSTSKCPAGYASLIWSFRCSTCTSVDPSKGTCAPSTNYTLVGQNYSSNVSLACSYAAVQCLGILPPAGQRERFIFQCQ